MVSVSQTKPTNVVVLLLSCAPGPPTLSILVSTSLHCSVNGVVHSIVPDFQFLGNFSHGMAFTFQNKNRLMSFRRKVFVSGHFEHVIKPTNADAPDTVFSCANIIAKGFSNDQLAFYNDKLGLANTTCH